MKSVGFFVLLLLLLVLQCGADSRIFGPDVWFKHCVFVDVTHCLCMIKDGNCLTLFDVDSDSFVELTAEKSIESLFPKVWRSSTAVGVAAVTANGVDIYVVDTLFNNMESIGTVLFDGDIIDLYWTSYGSGLIIYGDPVEWVYFDVEDPFVMRNVTGLSAFYPWEIFAEDSAEGLYYLISEFGPELAYLDLNTELLEVFDNITYAIGFNQHVYYLGPAQVGRRGLSGWQESEMHDRNFIKPVSFLKGEEWFLFDYEAEFEGLIVSFSVTAEPVFTFIPEQSNARGVTVANNFGFVFLQQGMTVYDLVIHEIDTTINSIDELNEHMTFIPDMDIAYSVIATDSHPFLITYGKYAPEGPTLRLHIYNISDISTMSFYEVGSGIGEHPDLGSRFIYYEDYNLIHFLPEKDGEFYFEILDPYHLPTLPQDTTTTTNCLSEDCSQCKSGWTGQNCMDTIGTNGDVKLFINCAIQTPTSRYKVFFGYKNPGAPARTPDAGQFTIDDEDEPVGGILSFKLRNFAFSVECEQSVTWSVEGLLIQFSDQIFSEIACPSVAEVILTIIGSTSPFDITAQNAIRDALAEYLGIVISEISVSIPPAVKRQNNNELLITIESDSGSSVELASQLSQNSQDQELVGNIENALGESNLSLDFKVNPTGLENIVQTQTIGGTGTGDDTGASDATGDDTDAIIAPFYENDWFIIVVVCGAALLVLVVLVIVVLSQCKNNSQ